ncbi:MAG: hypothetical protein KGQ66_05110 [Acidobacteriota bacterium]|nr:hypothetical protein [Acidobacteriota bacterium]
MTLIAPKRAVLIDDPGQPILEDLLEASPGTMAHPSESTGSRAGRTRTRSGSRRRAVGESVAMTCCSCRITYLPTAISSPAVLAEEWVCDGCRPHGEVGDRQP